jgi:hypothetical protein
MIITLKFIHQTEKANEYNTNNDTGQGLGQNSFVNFLLIAFSVVPKMKLKING